MSGRFLYSTQVTGKLSTDTEAGGGHVVTKNPDANNAIIVLKKRCSIPFAKNTHLTTIISETFNRFSRAYVAEL